jgi:hypothetical protein
MLGKIRVPWWEEKTHTLSFTTIIGLSMDEALPKMKKVSVDAGHFCVVLGGIAPFPPSVPKKVLFLPQEPGGWSMNRASEDLA